MLPEREMHLSTYGWTNREHTTEPFSNAASSESNVKDLESSKQAKRREKATSYSGGKASDC